jgi:methionine-rich copper-binding protein CopC
MIRAAMIKTLRRPLFGLAVAFVVTSAAAAEDILVLDSEPKAKAVIGEPSSAFFVRFDRPIDHRHSSLSIWRGDELVERLQPRLESAPEVLFARAPTLPPGSYSLRWAVRTMEGVKLLEGAIPFTVTGKQ